MWATEGLDFEELAGDIATEVRLLHNLNAEIAAMEHQIEGLYDEANPKDIVVSTPGISVTLSAASLAVSATQTASPTWRGALLRPHRAQDRPVRAGRPAQGSDQGR